MISDEQRTSQSTYGTNSNVDVVVFFFFINAMENRFARDVRRTAGAAVLARFGERPDAAQRPPGHQQPRRRVRVHEPGRCECHPSSRQLPRLFAVALPTAESRFRPENHLESIEFINRRFRTVDIRFFLCKFLELSSETQYNSVVPKKDLTKTGKNSRDGRLENERSKKAR